MTSNSRGAKPRRQQRDETAPTSSAAGHCTDGDAGAPSVAADATLFATVMQSLPVAVWVTDASGRVTLDNAAARRICGRIGSSLDFGGRDAGGAPIVDGDWPLQRALRGQPTSARRLRCICGDGGEHLLVQTATPLRDAGHAITGAVLIAEDITDLEHARQQHARNEALLTTVFDLLPVGVWVADAEGRIVMANPAGERIWRGTSGARSFDDYRAWRVDSGQPVMADDWALSRAIRSGETSSSELLRIRCFDGSEATVINWAAPITTAGSVQGGVAVVEDVTTLQRTREELMRTVQEREALLATVSHDLRNPLASLQALADGVEREAARLAGGDRLQAIARPTRAILGRALRLVEDLLSVASERLCAGSTLQRASVPARQLFDAAVAQALPAVEAAGLHLCTSCEGSLPQLDVDLDRVLRVFDNLIDNAIRHTEQGGTVTMTAGRTPAGAVFSVANEGPALPPQQLKQMFAPFWQADKGARGSGLGLSICRDIINSHGENIWAEPASGQRVRMCFVLPAGCAPSPAP